MNIYKGNDKLLTFKRLDSKGQPILIPPQKMWFTVKKSLKENEQIILQKKYTGQPGEDITEIKPGEWQIWIKAADTDNLQTGDYICDLKIKDDKGLEYTILKPTKFSILPTVTLNPDEGGDISGNSL